MQSSLSLGVRPPPLAEPWARCGDAAPLSWSGGARGSEALLPEPTSIPQAGTSLTGTPVKGRVAHVA